MCAPNARPNTAPALPPLVSRTADEGAHIVDEERKASAYPARVVVKNLHVRHLSNVLAWPACTILMPLALH